MSDNNFSPSTEFKFAPTDLSSIYLGLSENNVEDVEDKNQEETLLYLFEKTFNKNFRQIDTKLLSSKVDLINKSFIMFWKVCRQCELKICSVFIFYCDYFDIDYNLIYKNLHAKLKSKIENDLIVMVGGYANYERIRKSFKSNHNTLFDLI